MPTRKQRRSQRQERNAAERIGGRTTPGSGNGWHTKNDVKTDDLSIEVKYTDKKSYSLKLEDLEKAERNALLDSGREAGFLVGFGRKSGHGSMVIDREYYVVPRDYFERLRSGNPE